MADINFSSIDSIFDAVRGLFKIGKSPTPPIPPPLILSGVPKRSGLSAQKTAAKIIKRKSEAGLPIGNLPDGNQNPDEIMIRVIVEEVFRAIQQEAKVSVAIQPGTTLSGAGGNAGGPVSIIGSTITIGIGSGIIE